ncbi:MULTISPECIES: hypothetical protein [unclassified Streptomyces]|uniref:hypothetical protein n=1 Tax=unclassified Streptomyces TaxID=2593676 RepID=UPI001CBB4A91|nr:MULTISPECIES: hypothetical protein [unclassified Streptomyces]WPO76611.1 hypothetical protein R9806_38850 [Streptomyces sp. KN37]
MADGIVGAITGLLRGRRREPGLARVDAEITAFGEMLAGHSFAPGDHKNDPGLLADCQRALDAYEQAKRSLVGDRNLQDATDVLRALDEGRHALACVEAVLEGRPRSRRRPLCFFDPRHGQSTVEVRWAPSEGAARMIALCAADAVRLAEGVAPIETGLREQWSAPQPDLTSHPTVAARTGAKGARSIARPPRLRLPHRSRLLTPTRHGPGTPVRGSTGRAAAARESSRFATTRKNLPCWWSTWSGPRTPGSS